MYFQAEYDTYLSEILDEIVDTLPKCDAIFVPMIHEDSTKALPHKFTVSCMLPLLVKIYIY